MEEAGYMHDDLRGWLEKAEKMGKVQHIKGAHWDREMACLAELFVYRRKLETPALLFEDIPGIDKKYRVLFHELITPWATALAMDFEPRFETLVDLVKIVHEKIEHQQLIPPKFVENGPILENVYRGDDVHMLDLPVPRFSEFDGGRYIGTSDVVIVRDPDTDWVNLGTYRMQLYDDKSCALFISPGKHANIIRQKYFDRGLPCPVAVCLGQDPSLMLFASNEVPYGICEYDLVGGIKGKPVEVIKGPETGLPIPASAEIVIEGYCYPDDTMPEGPFPEWTGYYGSSSRAEPVMRV
jgi:UbiD family decarboxylase